MHRILPPTLAALLGLSSVQLYAVNDAASRGGIVEREASTAASARLAPDDIAFIDKVGAAGTAEIATSKLALKQGKGKDVQEFAGHMIEDHQKLADKLTLLARGKKHAVPAQTPADLQSTMTRLSGLKGDAFDAAYIQFQVSAHQDAVHLFEKEAESGNDLDVRQFAAQTLPLLQEHLHAIQQISAHQLRSVKPLPHDTKPPAG
ncbi:DUF4142 domain-containing protein [Silvimonas iriomotensis]|uniref:DUF4142 domain-containing protein n=1 Tax=Silvimonas iriomotensis TaxID=449662 RepID=A0ABQ2P425_9NEIS|nr:DUF4142 domain-containing protein [Silvimonas iriomotensis]GGP17681.1 hypothetical protein GCM10010970_00950 [Silvimonas iriomotensis]